MKKLPVFATVSEALKGAFAHFGTMVRLVWLPGSIYIGISILVGWMDITSQVDFGDEISMTDFAGSGASSWAALLNFASIFLWPMIAIAWHRFVILGEDNGLYWRFKAREWKFLGANLVVFAPYLAFIVLVVLVMFAMNGTDMGLAEMGERGPMGMADNPMLQTSFAILFIVGFFAATYYAVRLILLLPAMAVDQPFDPSAILAATKGNFWRLSFTFFWLTIAVLILYVLVGITFFISPIVTIALAPVVVIFAQITGVAVLSIAYRELVGAPGLPAATGEMHTD